MYLGTAIYKYEKSFIIILFYFSEFKQKSVNYLALSSM